MPPRASGWLLWQKIIRTPIKTHYRLVSRLFCVGSFVDSKPAQNSANSHKHCRKDPDSHKLSSCFQLRWKFDGKKWSDSFFFCLRLSENCLQKQLWPFFSDGTACFRGVASTNPDNFEIHSWCKFEIHCSFKFSEPHNSSGRRFLFLFFALGYQKFYEVSRTQTFSYPTHRSSEEKRPQNLTPLRHWKWEISRNPSPQIWASHRTGYEKGDRKYWN